MAGSTAFINDPWPNIKWKFLKNHNRSRQVRNMELDMGGWGDGILIKPYGMWKRMSLNSFKYCSLKSIFSLIFISFPLVPFLWMKTVMPPYIWTLWLRYIFFSHLMALLVCSHITGNPLPGGSYCGVLGSIKTMARAKNDLDDQHPMKNLKLIQWEVGVNYCLHP